MRTRSGPSRSSSTGKHCVTLKRMPTRDMDEIEGSWYETKQQTLQLCQATRK
jgi:hypothetical protein